MLFIRLLGTPKEHIHFGITLFGNFLVGGFTHEAETLGRRSIAILSRAGLLGHGTKLAGTSSLCTAASIVS